MLVHCLWVVSCFGFVYNFRPLSMSLYFPIGTLFLYSFEIASVNGVRFSVDLMDPRCPGFYVLSNEVTNS
jgi:hypothetical protein